MTFINLLIVLQPDRCIHYIVQKNGFSFLSPRTLQSGIVKFVSKGLSENFLLKLELHQMQVKLFKMTL